ncbi:hypothetical protein HOLleu_14465 [Holothuria leucospilota]|uniref:Uncharacterized protein n=1 Tax=Holothuria leucospilota TaxID=206669 RepID=A0A9Q1C6I7_HOLLE|nr:hypothetical protein HOLleu_14465 [Holothuria leucospilota]
MLRCANAKPKRELQYLCLEALSKASLERPTVCQTAANLAVLQRNHGATKSCNKILISLTLQRGYHTTLANNRKDKRRLESADKDFDEAEKEEKRSKEEKSIEEEKKVEKEGVSYESGACGE